MKNLFLQHNGNDQISVRYEQDSGQCADESMFQFYFCLSLSQAQL